MSENNEEKITRIQEEIAAGKSLARIDLEFILWRATHIEASIVDSYRKENRSLSERLDMMRGIVEKREYLIARLEKTVSEHASLLARIDEDIQRPERLMGQRFVFKHRLETAERKLEILKEMIHRAAEVI